MGCSEKLYRYRGTSFGIGQGMVMVREVKPAGGGYGLELVVGKPVAEMPSGGGEGVMEDIVRIVHPVYLVHGLEAALVKPGIVRHQRQSFNLGRNLGPNFREHRRILGVFGRKPVHPLAEPLEILRFRMDEAVERIHHFSAAHNHNSNAAHAARLLIGRFKVLCWGDSYVGLIWK